MFSYLQQVSIRQEDYIAIIFKNTSIQEQSNKQKYSQSKQIKRMSTLYSLHEIVWAKCTGHPWWPAKISKITVYQDNVTIYKVLFYASYEYSQVLEEHLAAYDSFFLAKSVRMENPFLNRAILNAQRAINLRAAKFQKLKIRKSNPIIPDTKFGTFSYSGINVEQPPKPRWNLSNFKPLQVSDPEENKDISSGICQEDKQINNEVSNAHHSKLKQFCKKLYKLFKIIKCDRHEARMFCLQLMKKIQNSGFEKEQKLSLLIACIKREFSMLEILSFDQMKTRTIELFNKTLPLDLNRAISLAEA